MFKQILYLAIVLPYCVASYYQTVDLSIVESLTFYKNAYTTGRRLPPIPQLQCVGGNACNYAYYVQSVQCVNKGCNEFNEPQWSCSTEIDNRFKLGNVVVSCEGYTDSLDRLKLAGSCGLKYELHATNYQNVVSVYDDFCVFMFLVLCMCLCVIICYQYYPTYRYPTYRYPTYRYPTYHYPTYHYPTYHYPSGSYVTGYTIGTLSSSNSSNVTQRTSTGHGGTETR
jgi:hypothetical protein